MSWPGASNISSGITIDLGDMDKTAYDPATKIASIQPGGRWTDVYAALEKGGRHSHVIVSNLGS